MDPHIASQQIQHRREDWALEMASRRDGWTEDFHRQQDHHHPHHHHHHHPPPHLHPHHPLHHPHSRPGPHGWAPEFERQAQQPLFERPPGFDRQAFEAGPRAGAAWAEDFAASAEVGDAHRGWDAEFRRLDAGPAGAGSDFFADFERFGTEQQQQQQQQEMAAGTSTWAEEYNRVIAEAEAYVEPHNREYVFDQSSTEGVAALEAAVQRDDKDAAAWLRLGLELAESDEEVRAIQALRRAIALDPTCLKGLNALATSLANESDVARAVECLESWILATPAYRHLHVARAGPPDYRSDHARVVGMFLRAARLNPQEPDPDIQSALGVLYNISGEYDKAIDCFRTAIAMSPNDHTLWNRLGASLANSTPSRSEEAAEAYLRALEIRPTYLRAIANLGISLTNRMLWREAAEHYLGVLRMNPRATHLWDLVTMTFRSMRRDDLVQKAQARKVEVFSPEFNF
jgi:peroxin-5